MNKPYEGGHKGHKQGGPQPPSYPQGYIDAGYFDQEGSLKPELLTRLSSEVAKSFRELTAGQLRRFYGHAKTAEKAFNYSSDAKKLVNDIKALDAFVAEALGKNKVPRSFYKFINENVSRIKDSKDVIKGFLPHFQTVVAYHTYHYGENK